MPDAIQAAVTLCLQDHATGCIEVQVATVQLVLGGPEDELHDVGIGILEIPVYGKAMLVEEVLVQREDEVLVKHIVEVGPADGGAVGMAYADGIRAEDYVVFGHHLKDAVLPHLCHRGREQQTLALEPVGRQGVRNGTQGAALQVGTRILKEEIVLAEAWLVLIVFLAFLDEKFQLLPYPGRVFGLNQNLLQCTYTCYLKGGVIFLRKGAEGP